MASFDCNKRSVFNSPNSKSPRPQGPAEPVELAAYRNQIVIATIPFGTNRAAKIRAWMHTHVMSPEADGQKIFVFRQANGWTNIALTSQPTAPKLTCSPKTAMQLAYEKFMACPDVCSVTLKYEGTVITADNIEALEFDPLPEPQNGNDEGGSSRTDADVIIEEIRTVSSKVDILGQKFDALLAKLDQATPDPNPATPPAKRGNR